MAAPSLAATYVGSFKAIVTSGTFEDNDADGNLIYTNLAGQTVNVRFKVTTFPSYVVSGDIVPERVFGTGSVSDSLFSINVVASSDGYGLPPEILFANASFSGAYNSGAVELDNDDEYDGGRLLTLYYSGASTLRGPVSGSGSANEYLNVSYGTNAQDTFTSLSYNLISGSVQSVPEPSEWAMMIVGYGIVGAIVRRGRPATLARSV